MDFKIKRSAQIGSGNDGGIGCRGDSDQGKAQPACHCLAAGPDSFAEVFDLVLRQQPLAGEGPFHTAQEVIQSEGHHSGGDRPHDSHRIIEGVHTQHNEPAQSVGSGESGDGHGAYRNQYPSQLSGGQQQRVGVARAFAVDPPIVLMDEPFSALDPMTRAELQDEIHTLQKKTKKTVVFVTHDMDEAIKLADRICIIQEGHIVQCDTPERILKAPANQYVTDFIGANRLWANPEYIRARDIMRRRPITISRGRTVLQALQIMRQSGVDSLLVVDGRDRLLGVLWLEELMSEKDGSGSAETYLSDDYVAVEGDTTLKEIISTIDYDVSGIIPVIEHDRTLVGFLTKSSLLATMSRQFVPEHTAGERSGVIWAAAAH